RQWQELFWKRRYSATNIEAQPDFVKLAEAYGAVGMRIEREDQVEEALKKAMEINNLPVVMDFHILREENVYPMIPAGQSVEDMMGHK
ncbi:MAG TPA: acetolactate synthase large subunit, partial [Armatimonadetes bacterium]|nr:acetolactate synthase large subunit [Armatimonadota bacterium]